MYFCRVSGSPCDGLRASPVALGVSARRGQGVALMASPVARPVAVATVSRSAGGDLGGPILYIKGGDGLARGSRGSVVRVSALDALHGLASGSQGVALMVSPCGSPCSRWSAGGGVSGSPFMASPVWDQVAGVSLVPFVVVWCSVGAKVL